MENQSKFEGWAIVEVMGHQRFAGFVTTESYGGAVLFRVDVPDLAEKEETTLYHEYSDEHSGYQHIPAGSKVVRAGVSGFSKLFGAASIYCISPCTEEAARAAVESCHPRPLKSFTLPVKPALPAPHEDEEPSRDRY